MRRCLVVAASMMVCLVTGCVVRSIYPWLSEDTEVNDVSLAAAWYDEDKDQAAFFSTGKDSGYDILLVGDQKDLSKFSASLHRLDNVLLLVVGPQEPVAMEAMTLMPGHILFKVELRDDTMKLYEVALDSLEERLKESQIESLPEGNEKDGYVLVSPTTKIEAFVKSQLKNEEFFKKEPLYSFKRVSKKPAEKAAAPPPSAPPPAAGKPAADGAAEEPAK